MTNHVEQASAVVYPLVKLKDLVAVVTFNDGIEAAHEGAKALRAAGFRLNARTDLFDGVADWQCGDVAKALEDGRPMPDPVGHELNPETVYLEARKPLPEGADENQVVNKAFDDLMALVEPLGGDLAEVDTTGRGQFYDYARLLTRAW
jgi:hypothetical protein